MPRVPVPPEIDEFLARPNPAVVATVSPRGAPHTAATWYDWEDGRVLLNMDESRLRLRYMRQNPAVALTVLGEDDWYGQVTLLGRLRATPPDDPDWAPGLRRRLRGTPGLVWHGALPRPDDALRAAGRAIRRLMLP